MSLAYYYFTKKNKESTFSISTNIYWATTMCQAWSYVLEIHQLTQLTTS